MTISFFSIDQDAQPTRQIFNLHMLSLQLVDQFGLDRVRCDTGGVGHRSVDGGERARGEGERRPLDGVWTEEVTGASAQDSEGGGGAEEHQARSIWRGDSQDPCEGCCKYLKQFRNEVKVELDGFPDGSPRTGRDCGWCGHVQWRL